MDKRKRVRRQGPPDADSNLIRVLNLQGKTAGTAVAIDDELAISCAHVIDPHGKYPDDVPPHDVTLDFHYLDRIVTAQVVENGWHPVQADGAGDFVVLRLSEPVPGLNPAPLRLVADARGTRVEARGYPESTPVSSRTSQGRLSNRSRREWIQIDPANPGGWAPEKGFSGGPVWDRKRQAVIGLTVMRDAHRVSHMLPLDYLCELWPPLVSRLQPDTISRRRKLIWLASFGLFTLMAGISIAAVNLLDLEPFTRDASDIAASHSDAETENDGATSSDAVADASTEPPPSGSSGGPDVVMFPEDAALQYLMASAAGDLLLAEDVLCDGIEPSLTPERIYEFTMEHQESLDGLTGTEVEIIENNHIAAGIEFDAAISYLSGESREQEHLTVTTGPSGSSDGDFCVLNTEDTAVVNDEVVNGDQAIQHLIAYLDVLSSTRDPAAAQGFHCQDYTGISASELIAAIENWEAANGPAYLTVAYWNPESSDDPATARFEVSIELRSSDQYEAFIFSTGVQNDCVYALDGGGALMD